LDILNNKNASFIASLLYLTYPVFFGHSLVNPKDIPFLVGWVICSFVSFRIAKNYLKEKSFSFKKIFLLSFFTAFLISIRFAGFLILAQYLFLLLILLNVEKIKFNEFVKKEIKKISFFVINIFFFTFILYPSIWSNPFDLYNGIVSSTKFYNDVCTYTFGKCIKASNLSASYIPIWLLLKLPIIVLIGVPYFIFNEKKILHNKVNKLYLGTFILTAIFIYIFIIVFKVRIYNEIRHLLFFLNLILIPGIISIFYLSKNFFFILSIGSIAVFIAEIIYIHPYQYSWFNLPSRVINLQKNFQIDYWGVSNRNLYTYFKKNFETHKSSCVYGDHYIEIFLNEFDCKKNFSELNTAQKPFFIVQNLRYTYKSFPDCKLLYEEKFRLFFYSQDLIAGKIVMCS